jgi:hypothetical protein
MQPLEKLFRLEMEFHRRLRTQMLGYAETAGLHTSYALQSGYESLIRAIDSMTALDIERVRERLGGSADARDVVAARDSLEQLLGIGR